VIRIEEARVAKKIFESAVEHPFNVAQLNIFKTGVLKLILSSE
jgi:hypothetical protein